MSGKIPPSLIGTVDDEIHAMYLQIQKVRAFSTFSNSLVLSELRSSLLNFGQKSQVLVRLNCSVPIRELKVFPPL